MSALPWMQHLIVVPVLLPLLVGALLIPVAQTRHGLKFAASAALHSILPNMFCLIRSCFMGCAVGAARLVLHQLCAGRAACVTRKGPLSRNCVRP